MEAARGGSKASDSPVFNLLTLNHSTIISPGDLDSRVRPPSLHHPYLTDAPIDTSENYRMLEEHTQIDWYFGPVEEWMPGELYIMRGYSLSGSTATTISQIGTSPLCMEIPISSLESCIKCA
jgi:hypothetical protein